ncbi:MAG: Phosphatidyl-myo-inositol mannosyltransferase [Gemmatimonadaceae bacterium]|nr:Phosphatidyl-myo-inositol mannosyltransferase [Gemmatimonadaceae bacterium]
MIAPGDEPLVRNDVHLVGHTFPVQVNGSVARLCFSPSSSRRIRRVLAAFRPQIVHVHDPLSPSTSMLATLHAKAPVVATFHSYFAREHLEGRIYTAVAPLLRPVWRRVDRRVAVSNAARFSVCSRMGSAPVLIVPNGADIDTFANAPRAALPPGRRLLFVGRLEPRKGFPIAVRAFAALATDFPDLQLVVIGDGADRNAVAELEPTVRDRVHMLGRVPDGSLPTYHQAADIFISPATGQESFGIVLVEAMAAGLPIVASDIPGYREVARDGVEGLLVAPADPAALAEGVRTLLERPELATTLGARAARRSREFAWDNIIDRLEDVYAELAGRDTSEHQVAFAEA